MIKTCVLGAGSPLAGELIRILIHHPEVDFLYAHSPQNVGKWIGSVHLGLVGDTEMRFADRVDLSECDVAFICDDHILNIGDLNLPQHIKVILVGYPSDLSIPDSLRDFNLTKGLSESFRKPLVREANGARILHPVEAVTLISIFPLALHLMLPEDIKVQASLPYWLTRTESKLQILEDINSSLQSFQLSFNGIKNFETSVGKDARAVTVRCTLQSSVSIEEIKKIYESIYNDHNFTFIVENTPDKAEVIGTQKCLLHIFKPSADILEIEAVADGVYRGGVGDAVHSMNLLFGLFEKIGLSFKAPLAFKESYS